jgi:integrase
MSFVANGRHYRRSTRTKDRKLAQRIFAKVQTEITEDKWFEKDAARNHTYDEMIERFLQEHAPTVSSSMQRSYQVCLRHLDAFFSGLTLDRISPGTVMQYVTSRRASGCSAATRNRELAVLSKAFNCSRLWRWVRENPVQLVKREKERSDVGRVLQNKEEKALIAAAHGLCNGDLPDIILYVLNTGVRIGQVPLLQWQHIDLTKRTVRTYNQKSKSWYSLPLTDSLLEMFSRRSKVRHISGYVFPSERGTRLDNDNLRRAFGIACRKAGIKEMRFHDLRHSAATRLAQAGVDIYAIAAFLNHSQLSTTKRYAKHNVESLRRVVEVLDRDGTNG